MHTCYLVLSQHIREVHLLSSESSSVTEIWRREPLKAFVDESTKGGAGMDFWSQGKKGSIMIIVVAPMVGYFNHVSVKYTTYSD